MTTDTFSDPLWNNVDITPNRVIPHPPDTNHSYSTGVIITVLLDFLLTNHFTNYIHVNIFIDSYKSVTVI